MGRPKTENPKRLVTLRLRPELIARYAALGGSWRAHMEAALERFGHPAPPPVVPKAVERLAPVRKHVSRLKGEWKAP